MSSDHDRCLSDFNNYRTSFGQPKLRWNQKLADSAKERAAALRAEGRLAPDGSLDDDIGETRFLDEDAAAKATCEKAALIW